MEQSRPKLQQQDHIAAYQQFCRLYLVNAVLTTQLKQILYDKAELSLKLSRLMKRAEEMGDGGTANEDKKRRIRRTASEIQRRFKCQVEHCGKSYGSEGSLNQHIKLKHPELYQSFPQAVQDAAGMTINERNSEDDSV